MKNRKQAKSAPATTETTASATPSKVLKVKQGLTFSGKRKAWYERLCQFDGKTVAELQASIEKDNPAHYGNRSKHAGKPETFQGWFRFYERNGYVTQS